VLAGFLATFAILASAIGLVHRPVPLTAFGILLSVIAAGMSARYERLAAAALAISCTCFVLGLVIAILAGHPIF
jgi:hypothetical protein